MDNAVNVKTNTLFNVIKSVFGIIYPLITFPYISRVLLTENVGKISFGGSVVSYFSLIASLGVTTYAVRECSRFKGDRSKLEDAASQILSINIFSTLFAYTALAVTLIVARPLDNYRTLIIIQSSAIMFTTLGADWLNTAMEDFRFIAIRTMGMQVFSLILMFLFVRKPEDYLIYAVISVIASSGANVINIFYRRRYCRTRFVLHINWKRHLPPIFLLFSLILSQTIYTSSDTTILGLCRGDFEVGLYSTSVKIYNIVNTVVASVAWVVMPQLSFNYANKNYTEINRLLKYSLNFIIVLGLPCLVGINVITKEIILLIAGETYLGAELSLRILTLSLAFSFIGGWIGNMMFLPSGREKISLVSSIVGASVNIILNLIFIPIWGLNAAAATTAFAELLGLIIGICNVEKEIHIDGVKKMLVAPIVGSVVIIIVSILVRWLVKSPYMIAVLTIVFSALMYMMVLVLMKNEFTMNFLRPIISKLKRRR